VAALGRSVFTTYLFPFEITAGLLIIAVVGAVVLARRPHPGAEAVDGPEPDQSEPDAGPLDEGSAVDDGVESTESISVAVAGTVTAARPQAAPTPESEEGER
jgi:hypothetical protein